MSVIVSLTTISARIGLLKGVLASIEAQTVPPDEIVLNISKDPYLFDDGIEELPDWMEDHEVSVNWTKNTGPYRKLIPTMESCGSDDVVVTIDDDIIYGETWLENLLSSAEENPDCIICSNARRIRRNFLGRFANYRTWPSVKAPVKSTDVLPIGNGGVLYKKRLLDLDFLFDEAYAEIAPTTDDLWFKVSSMRKGTRIVVIPDNRYHHETRKRSGVLFRRNNRSETPWIGKALLYPFRPALDYLGVNYDQNDRNWDGILRYSASNAPT